MLFPTKAKANNADSTKLPKKEQSAENQETSTAPPQLTGRWDFSRLFTVAADPDVVSDVTESAKNAQHTVSDAWKLTVQAADKGTESVAAPDAKTDSQTKNDGRFMAAPMTHEEVRLWLQSFNAGPYATLKYKGDVPFEETKNYVPRVLKYYEEIDESPYDEQINKAAAKWGHDPRMIRAIMATESYFKNDTTSHAGARGLMQVMPVVWKDIKEKYDLDWEYSTGVFEPEKNIEVACAYLAWLRYDFLPRHFEAFDRNPDAPTILVRDHDRGVPDRKTPRIIAASDETTKRGVEVASAGDASELITSSKPFEPNGEAEDKATAGASEKEVKAEKKAKSKTTGSKSDKTAKADSDEEKSVAKAASRGKIEVSDAAPSKTAARKTSNGKTKVVMRGGSGKKISISVDSKGKVTASNRSKASNAATKGKKAELARASSSKASEEGQGG